MTKLIQRNSLFLTTLILISTIFWFTRHDYRDFEYSSPYQFQSDIGSYYSYLPALFIHNDIFFKEIDNDLFWLNEGTENYKIPKFTMGMAFMYAPFFLIGHGIATITDYEANGFTAPYSKVIRFGSYIYFIIGLFYLIRLLQVYYNRKTVFITIIAIYFASNLFYYVVGISENSCTYLFAIFSVCIYLTYQIWNKQKYSYLYLLSFLCGLAVVIRPSELLFIVIPLFWGITDLKRLKSRLNFIFQHPKKIIISVVFFVLPLIPQLIYWKYSSGSFIYTDFYPGEKFYFSDPKIFNFLLSYRKGWFVYSPLMLFSLIGFFWLKKYVVELSIVLPIYIVLTIYILSSWWCWWYGGSLGMRSMIQYHALLTFPLAAAIQTISKRKILSAISFLVLLGLIYFNLNLTHQQRYKMVHWDGMNKELFWYIFLKEKHNEQEWKEHLRLVKEADIEKAMRGEDI